MSGIKDMTENTYTQALLFVSPLKKHFYSMNHWENIYHAIRIAHAKVRKLL